MAKSCPVSNGVYFRPSSFSLAAWIIHSGNVWEWQYSCWWNKARGLHGWGTIMEHENKPDYGYSHVYGYGKVNKWQFCFLIFRCTWIWRVGGWSAAQSDLLNVRISNLTPWTRTTIRISIWIVAVSILFPAFALTGSFWRNHGTCFQLKGLDSIFSSRVVILPRKAEKFEKV